MIVIKFNNFIKNITADSFCKYLKKLGVKKIIAGSDFKFGLDNNGDTNLLKKYFELDIIEDVFIDNFKVSSTKIKELIKAGNLDLANKYLGYLFYTTGKIVRGNKIGRKLGYRTANIKYNNKILPPNGVYLGYLYLKNNKYYTILNIGYNPSLNRQSRIRCEAHILNFNKNIYNKKVKLVYLKRLRDEVKFKDKNDLINQLNKDYENALKIIKNEEL